MKAQELSNRALADVLLKEVLGHMRSNASAIEAEFGPSEKADADLEDLIAAVKEAAIRLLLS